ncbi:MAG: YqgE/AlgH family protein [Corynebacterium sp.]|uniref:YqgE/AlgH family protein n=1 Tax=Corynebacterium sp. TaxID=1720 RepID=UPI0026DD4C83|nr:YqgE/AlgH family protein [Corynebacterium sp.]MDO4761695.1 YqgE/AlgH family protein [Corynebacterium sp.]
MSLFAHTSFRGIERSEPAPGMLLISAPDMNSDDFRRSVVVLIDHGQQGTFGVVINDISEQAVANVLPEWALCMAKPQAVFIGGPLFHENALVLGVAKPEVDIDAAPYLNRLANRIVHVDMRADPTALVHELEGARFFVGWAEWAPGQLEHEIERGDWFVAPCLPGDIIAPGKVDVWADALKRQPMPMPLLSTHPGYDQEEN